MGMYDYVICEYPLPGNPPEWAKEFQTKDLDCQMDTYTITADGRLVGNEDLSDFTGTIEFYDSNVVASGPGTYTQNGEDAQWAEYRAIFVVGKLSELREIENRRERAAKYKPREYPRLTDEDRQSIGARREESLIGKTMWLWWGSLNPDYQGYSVTVIAENSKEWVAQSADGSFEKVGRYQRDNCFHDSYEDGKRYNDERKAEWERKKAEYEAAISAPAEAP